MICFEAQYIEWTGYWAVLNTEGQADLHEPSNCLLFRIENLHQC